MSDKKILGRIDCPYCGFEQGGKVTLDKNGNPFVHSDLCCDGQLRVGGKPYRVDAFYKKYPHLKEAENPVTVTEPNSAVTEPETETVTEPETPPPAAKKTGFKLNGLGG